MVGRGLPVVRPARLGASAALPEAAEAVADGLLPGGERGFVCGGRFRHGRRLLRSFDVLSAIRCGAGLRLARGRGWRTARPRGKRPCFARFACGCGRALAPARFARLIARARQRAHFACALNQGRFAPGRHGREAARGCPFPRTHHTTLIFMSSPIRELLPNFLEAPAAPPPPVLCQPAGSARHAR